MEVDNKRIGELVTEIQQGNMNAFGKLYETVSPRSFFVALQIVKNKQDAEDILQDSFISALEKINTIDNPESFVGWFNRIVANKSKDFLKKKKPMLFDEEEKQVFELIPDDDREFSPQENLNDKETRKIIFDAVNELSDEKRICVLLHYYENMSIADIAETVGSNENTVKSRLYQARKDLSAKFSGKTSLYSVSPIALVLWMWRGFEGKITTNFIGSGDSAKIFTGITSKIAKGAVATAVSTEGINTVRNAVSQNIPRNVTPQTANTVIKNTGVNTGKKMVKKAVGKATGKVAKKASMSFAKKLAIGAVAATVGLGAPAGVVVAANSPEISAYVEQVFDNKENEPATVVDDLESTVVIDMEKYVSFVYDPEDDHADIIIDNESFVKDVSVERRREGYKELNEVFYWIDVFLGGPKGDDFFEVVYKEHPCSCPDNLVPGQVVTVQVKSNWFLDWIGIDLEHILEALNAELKSTSFEVTVVTKE